MLRRAAPVVLILYAVHTALLATSAVTGLWDTAYLAPGNALALLVQLALAALAWFCYRRPGRADVVVVIAAAGATTVALGLAATWRCASGAAPGWAALIDTLSLFLGGSDAPFGESAQCPAPAPLAWQAAQLAALIAVGVGAVGIIGVLFRSQLDRLAARTARGVVVVVSPDPALGEAVVAIRAQHPSHVRVVVLDDQRGPVRMRGVSVLAVDPGDVGQLAPILRRRRRSVLRAVHLFGRSAARNEELLAVFEHIERESRPRTGAPALAHVRIDDVWQAEYWRRARVGRESPLAEDAFSLREGTASEILDRLGELDCDLIVAAGDRGLSAALSAELSRRTREDRARRGAPSGPLPLLVLVGDDAQELDETQRILQRRFGNDPLPIRTAERLTIARIPEIVGDARAPALLLLDDALAEQASGIAAAHPSLVVFAHDARLHGVARAPEMERLYLFGPTVAPAAGVWERLAEIVHGNYVHEYGVDPAQPARRPWHELDDFHRESNLRLVTTTLASAVALGRSWGPASDAEPDAGLFAASEIEIAARAEHESWMRHLTANGWRRGAERDEKHRTHPLLCPWEELDDDSRGRARGSVLGALALLAVAGYHAIADAAPERPFVRRGRVTAVREREPWTWTTDGGSQMSADAGDWRVDDGEREWSVRDAEFRATYTSEGAGRWRRTGEVRARRAVRGERVVSLEGTAVADGEDEWVVRGAGGEEWLVPGDHFAAAYALAPQAARGRGLT